MIERFFKCDTKAILIMLMLIRNLKTAQILCIQLWRDFLRFWSAGIFSEENSNIVFQPCGEVMTFFLDWKFLSSLLIPEIFRFANEHFCPEFDAILGRTFMNLRPFFLVFVGLISQGKEIEFIPINIGEIKYFAQIREKISALLFGRTFEINCRLL